MLTYSKSIHSQKITVDDIAIIAYITMYPGFFIYHDLVGQEVISMFAGGWASNFNILFTLILFPMVLFFTMKENNALGMTICVLFLIIFLYALYYRFIGKDHQSDNLLFINTLKLGFGLISIYSIGIFYPKNDKMKHVLIFSWVIMVALALFSTDWRILSYTIPERIVPSGTVSDYQGFATAFALTCILSITLISNKFLIGIFTAISSIILFIIGSRSDMLGFVIASFALSTIYFTEKRIYSMFIVFLCATVPIITMLNIPTIINTASPHIASMRQRMSATIDAEQATPADSSPSADGGKAPLFGSANSTRREEDASSTRTTTEPIFSGNMRQEELLDIKNAQGLGIRIETLKAAWAGISNSPVVGDYGGQLRDFGQFGMYAHNVLSSWQQFGIIGFFIYFGATVFSAFYLAWVVLWKRERSALSRSAFLASAYTLPLIIISKSVYWPIPALIWGMALNVAVARRHIPTRPVTPGF